MTFAYHPSSVFPSFHIQYRATLAGMTIYVGLNRRLLTSALSFLSRIDIFAHIADRRVPRRNGRHAHIFENTNSDGTNKEGHSSLTVGDNPVE